MSDRALIYLRVSSEAQSEKYSLPSQEAACRAYATQRGYQVEEVITDVMSGEILERPGLTRIFTLIVDRQIQVMVVFGVDRLTRAGAAHHAVIQQRLAQNDVRLEFVNGGYTANSPEALLSQQIQSTIAWYENQQRRERQQRGLERAARAGHPLVCARPPYGYRMQDRQLLPEPEEAAVVRQIFAWAAEGVAIHEITRRLGAQQTPSAGDKNPALQKSNAHAVWGRSTVRKILGNETYIGNWRYRKHKNVRTDTGIKLVARPQSEQILVAIPAIVTPEIFAAVQERLQKNPKPVSLPARTLLHQMVFCTCGKSCATSARRGVFSYRCNKRAGEPWRGVCAAPVHINSHVLDAIVWRALVEQLLDPAQVSAWLDERRSDQATPLAELQRQLAAAQAAITDADRRLGILLDQMLMGDYVGSVLAEERQRLLHLRSGLAEHAALLQARLDDNAARQVREQSLVAVAQQLRNGLAELDLAAQREVLQLLQVRVRMLTRTTAHVEAILPLAVPVLTVPKLKKAKGGKDGGGKGDPNKGDPNKGGNQFPNKGEQGQQGPAAGKDGAAVGIETTSLKHCGRQRRPLPARAWHVPGL